MLTFVISYCCHLQSTPLTILCIKSSICATAGSTVGTDILELLVGWSAFVSEFQTYPGNDTLRKLLLCFWV
jgi:hypothetical protein